MFTRISSMGIFMLVAVASMVNALKTETKLTGKIDLAIIGPCNAASSNMKAFKEACIGLPNHIEMAPDKVRVAIVDINHVTDPSHRGRILFNLSGNSEDFLKWANGWDVTTTTRDVYFHNEGFRIVREEVFKNFTVDKDRAKMVIMVINGWTDGIYSGQAVSWIVTNKTRIESELIRSHGGYIYINYDAFTAPLVNGGLHKWAQWYAGEKYPWRAHGAKYDGDHHLFFANCLQDIVSLTRVIRRDMCTFCHFEEKNQERSCTPTNRPAGNPIDFFGDNNTACAEETPTTIECHQDECEFECDRQWPWNNDDTSCTLCGEVKREGDPPRKMELCNRSTCAPCPTTTPGPTTSTMSTTPAPLMTKQIKKSEGMETTIILGSIGGVAAVAIIVIAVAVVMIRKKSAADKEKAELLLRQKIDERAADKAKHKHRVIGAGAKTKQDSMAVSLVSTRDQSKVVKSANAGKSVNMAKSVKSGGVGKKK